MEDKNDLIFPVWVSKNIQYLYNYMQWNLRLAARFGRKLFTLEDLMTKLHWSANKKQKHVFVCCCLSLFYVYTHTLLIYIQTKQKNKKSTKIDHSAFYTLHVELSSKSSPKKAALCTSNPFVRHHRSSLILRYRLYSHIDRWTDATVTLR